MSEKKNWTGPLHCPDCPNEHGCIKTCNRRFAREMQDFLKKQAGVIS